MAGVCPGQSTSFWKFEDIYNIPCVACGGLVEFFKTDVKRACPHCRQVVMNPKMDFACAEWCSKAEECLGPVVYGEFMEKKQLEAQRQQHFERLLGLVPEGDEELAALFRRLYRENPDPTRLLDLDQLRSLGEAHADLVARATACYGEFMRSRVAEAEA
ncbi:MAG: hypothetical protein HY321_14305 [Armatimonadetes bacterium]|nr:hypothetical protein [Armatimonadota bacterium]